MTTAPAPITLPPPDPPELPEGARSAPRWPARYAFFALIAGLGTTILSGGALVPVVAPLFLLNEDLRDPLLVLVGTVAQDAIFILAAVSFASIVSPVRPAQFGLRRTRLWRAVGLCCGTAALYVGLSVAWYALTSPSTGGEEHLLDQTSTAGAVIFGIVVIVVAPLAEEFFFRGFMYQALRNRLQVWGAAVVTGLIFGMAHVGTRSWQFLVPLAVFGFLLCLVFQRTRSLWPCVALHAANNILAFSLSL